MKFNFLFFVRALFLTLLAFEFLNWFKILHFSVEFTWFGLIVTAGGVYGFVECLHYYLKKNHQVGLPAMAFLFGFIPVFYDALGDVFHFYNIPGYDKVGHFFGSAMAAGVMFLFLWTLKRRNFINWRLGTKMLFAFTVTVSFGVLYELEEFGEDLLTCYHKNLIPFLAEKLLPCGARFGDAYDTGSDLFFDVLGAAAAVLIGWAIITLSQRRASNVKIEI